ncbi:MAG: DNA replication/repair protein RecF [Clostridia bacterium]|nr:DNA replication/repair protein RecF [Clostridia bacterium]
MICRSIALREFRNVTEAKVDFSEGVNLICGENAQGKTNLLEAVYYCSVGRSFRTSVGAEMIRFGSPFAKVEMEYTETGRTRDQHLSFTLFRDKRRVAERNGVRIERMSELVGSFRTVLFCPEHLSLIKDGPGMRRTYLDMAISGLYPMYMHALQNYHHILRQRNALIKNAPFDRATFDATVELWSRKLAHEAAIIAEARLAYVKRASEQMALCFADMTGEREKPSMVYDGSSGQPEEEYADRKRTEERYVQLLTSSYDREIAVGATLWGIHKDDLTIRLNGKNARIYASQGQQRSLALSMKLAEGEICREEFGDEPVLLLDDVLSELDRGRREYLVSRIKGKQVILTTCEEQERTGTGADKRIRVCGGCYEEES